MVVAKAEASPAGRQGPLIGERWMRRNKSNSDEIRTVVGRTPGGGVEYTKGKVIKMSVTRFCTLRQWREWASRAKALP